MTTTGNETLDRIQKEIKENLEREEELRKKYAKNNCNGNGEAIISITKQDVVDGPITTNNLNGVSPKVSTTVKPNITNGTSTPNGTNGFRKFSPNPSSKGMMHKFLKMRGKLSLVTLKPDNQTNWTNNNDSFEPARVTIEPGKPIRNGYISAEEKMRRELHDFQEREEELRKQRRKSQPDLMAALEAEAGIETNLKPARSMVQLYSNENLSDDNLYSSQPGSLKPAKSLAELCAASDEELDTPGTHSLIMQFEKMKQQQARA